MLELPTNEIITSPRPGSVVTGIHYTHYWRPETRRREREERGQTNGEIIIDNNSDKYQQMDDWLQENYEEETSCPDSQELF